MMLMVWRWLISPVSIWRLHCNGDILGSQDRSDIEVFLVLLFCCWHFWMASFTLHSSQAVIPVLIRLWQVVQLAQLPPSVSNDATALQGDLQIIFVALLFDSMGLLVCFQLAIEQPLWQAHTGHATHRTSAGNSWGLHIYSLCLLSGGLPYLEYYPSIWCGVIPGVSYVEGVQLLSKMTVDHPGFTDVQQGRLNDYIEHLAFGLETDTSSFPHIGL